MPTGYTAPLHDGLPISFADFAWRCARNFGALIHLRDEPMGAPSFSEALAGFSDVKHHEEGLAKAQAELQRLSLLRPEVLDEERRASHRKALEEHAECEEREAQVRRRYEEMLTAVQAWTAPTPDHEGLRRFMIEQLEESIRFDCLDLDPPTLQNLDAYRERQISSARWSVGYHERSLHEAREREAGRRRWVEVLHASIPCPRP